MYYPPQPPSLFLLLHTHLTLENQPLKLEEVSTEECLPDSRPQGLQNEVVLNDTHSKVWPEVQHEGAVSTAAEVTSSPDRFAAFDVPLTREIKPLPNRFSVCKCDLVFSFGCL